MALSLAERYAKRLAAVPREERPALVAVILREIGGNVRLLGAWKVWARPEQFAPADDVDFWRWWAVITGRGWGKTRTAAEWLLDRSIVFHEFGAKHRVALVGATAADVRDVMVEGESGLMACCELRGIRIDYKPSKRRVVLPDLGTVMTAFSAEVPNRLRGPQHHSGWGDELAAWPAVVDREGNTAWTNLDLGLRLPCPYPLRPQGVVTTTPKPIPAVAELVRAGNARERVALTTGTLYDNASNLSPDYVDAMRAKYEGTRLGAQELLGILLSAVEGALWNPEQIDTDRVHLVNTTGDELTADTITDQLGVDRIIIGVDPPGETAECGIVAVGREAQPADPLLRGAFVLEDASLAGPPEVWGQRVVDTYHRWGANYVAVEVNQGGDMCRSTIHAVDPSVPVKKVRASKGKQTRAEPIAVLYDKHRIHHVGVLVDLEGQMCTWVPGDDSPDRMDALVWALTYLFPDLTSVPVASGGADALTGARVPGRRTSGAARR